jgi:hypothetical protein
MCLIISFAMPLAVSCGKDGDEETGFGTTQCNDGSDNDRDGEVDANDADCEDGLDNNEAL